MEHERRTTMLQVISITADDLKAVSQNVVCREQQHVYELLQPIEEFAIMLLP